MSKPGRIKAFKHLKALVIPVLLIGLALLITVSTLLTQSGPKTQESIVDRSVYSSGPTGYKAWFLSAQKAGLPIQSWENSFNELHTLPQPATMLMVKPYTVSDAKIIFGRKDTDRLLQWVAAGNTLVILDDFKRFGSNALAYQLNLSVERSKATRLKPGVRTKLPPQPLRFVAENQLLRSFIHAPLVSRNNLSLQPIPHSPLLQQAVLQNTKGETVLLRIPYQKGHLLLGTLEDFAENGYLSQPTNDNFQFLSNLLVQEGYPIFVNEFVHGYLQAGDLLSYYQKKTPLGSVFAQLVLFFIALLWLSFVRWTPKPQQGKTPGQPTDTISGTQAYIRSLAGLYYRTKAASLALEPQLNRIETLLRKRFRINLDEEARLIDLLTNLQADYSSREESPQSLLQALKTTQLAIRHQNPIPHRELLKLSRQLTVIEERLQYGHRPQFNLR